MRTYQAELGDLSHNATHQVICSAYVEFTPHPGDRRDYTSFHIGIKWSDAAGIVELGQKICYVADSPFTQGPYVL